MAEALFKEVIASKGLAEKVAVGSAGIAAFPGLKATPQAQQVMLERGLDISQHISQPLTQEILEKADLVLAMTNSHLWAIKSEHNDHSSKVFLLKNYATKGRENGDIIDPFGSSVENYHKVATELEKYIKSLAERIKASIK